MARELTCVYWMNSSTSARQLLLEEWSTQEHNNIPNLLNQTYARICSTFIHCAMVLRTPAVNFRLGSVPVHISAVRKCLRVKVDSGYW